MDKASEIKSKATHLAQHAASIAVDLTETEQRMLLDLIEAGLKFPILKKQDEKKEGSTS